MIFIKKQHSWNEELYVNCQWNSGPKPWHVDYSKETTGNLHISYNLSHFSPHYNYQIIRQQCAKFHWEYIFLCYEKFCFVWKLCSGLKLFHGSIDIKNHIEIKLKNCSERLVFQLITSLTNWTWKMFRKNPFENYDYESS